MFSRSLSALTASVLFSCATIVPVVASDNPPRVAHIMQKVADTQWKLVSFGSPSAQKTPLTDTEITLEFSQDRLAGTGGCNRYMGGFQQDNHQLTITPLASTKMACAPEILQQEFDYMQLLQEVETVTINTQGELELRSPKGMLVFAPQQQVDRLSQWLDSEKPQNWNQVGASIPQAPKIEGGGNLSNCQKTVRRPSDGVDQALVKAGWTLYGAVQVYGNTSVRSAMANADGMCRPLTYQTFVFVGNQLAGTLSPTVMDSRTEGSLRQVILTGEASLWADFNRYTDNDALCCPSRTTNVTYTLEQHNGKPLLIPSQVSTVPA